MIILKDILKDSCSVLFNLNILFMKIEIDRGGKISLGGGQDLPWGGAIAHPKRGLGRH